MTQEDPLYLQNQPYSARELRKQVEMTWSEGVLEGLVVTEKAGGTNMSVDVSIGSAVIKGDDQANQGSYLATTTASENHAITAAPGSNARIDLVCYRINDPNATGPAGDNAEIIVVDGVASGSPVPPAVPTSAIPLAEVLVTAGDTFIDNDKISGRREAALVRGGVRPGSIVGYGGAESKVASDENWFLCDGGEMSRQTYFALFNEIGEQFGNGDGSTTFNRPDLRGCVMAGRDNMGGTGAGRLSGATDLGSLLGQQSIALTSAELPGHSHGLNNHQHAIDHDHPNTTTTGGADHRHVGLFKDPPSYPDEMFSGNSVDFGATTHDGITDIGSFESSGQFRTGAGGIHEHNLNLPLYEGSSGPASGNTTSVGSGQAFNLIQPTLVLNFLVRA